MNDWRLIIKWSTG